MNVLPGLGHHHILRQRRLQERLDLTDSFANGGAGGLYGVNDLSSCSYILQRSTDDLILPRLITQVKPELMPIGTRLIVHTVV